VTRHPRAVADPRHLRILPHTNSSKKSPSFVKVTTYLRLLLPGLLIASALLSSCIDEIELGQGAPLPEGIVLQGRINVEDTISDVRITLEELFRFENSNRPDRIVTATVRLVNEDEQSIVLPFRQGAYVASLVNDDPSFTIREGMSFRVEVETREGLQFTSRAETLPPKLEVERAYWAPGLATIINAIGETQEVPGVQYFVDAPLRYPDGSSAYMRWTLEETYQQTDESRDTITGIKTCYVTLPFEARNLRLSGDINENVNRIERFDLGTNRISFRYGEGHYMTVRQEALSRDAFEYFDQIASIASTELSIFEPPGGPVVGNVFDVNGEIDNVFGYFYVARQSVARVPVRPEEVGNPTLACPLNAMMPPPVNRCTDCLSVDGATTIRPPWWEL
jgi:hypothetical protein